LDDIDGEVYAMQEDRRIVSAIAAAVQMYIEGQQQVTASLQESSAYSPPVAAYSAWLVGGRQAAMELRRLWQMRLAR
jgi:hypothetical protein